MEHVDVLIVGAGLSGIGAACHLQRRCPGMTYAILESRDAIGGTWDLFRYPGVRSDSDMFTLGFSFRPWLGSNAIADGASILKYIRDTAREHDVERHIRFRHRVVRAAWSSSEARWTVDVEHDGTSTRTTCGFLYLCTGYYRYDEGYSPALPGRERFAGAFVHPQHWPAELDYTNKRVVVIGSGATAVTLVPSLAERAAHVTMLQRSPTYILALPSKDRVSQVLRRWLPEKLAYSLTRWKNVLIGLASFQLSRRRPAFMKGLIKKGQVRALPQGFDVETHFTPRYDPWDQRLCIVPDGDLFKALRAGKASIATGRIATLTEAGIELESGEKLDADVIVSATGLNVLAFGGLTLSMDGVDIDFGKTIAYRGMMLCGVPNFAYAIGYTNASWTLKIDLVSDYVCRVLLRMQKHASHVVTPRAPDPSLPTEPFLDLSSGYVQRAIAQLPKQGATTPWRLYQNYVRDWWLFKVAPVDDGHIDFR